MIFNSMLKLYVFNEITLRVIFNVVAGEGFEPSKAEPADLQSAPIGRSGNPPRIVKRSEV